VIQVALMANVPFLMFYVFWCKRKRVFSAKELNQLRFTTKMSLLVDSYLPHALFAKSHFSNGEGPVLCPLEIKLQEAPGHGEYFGLCFFVGKSGIN